MGFSTHSLYLLRGAPMGPCQLKLIDNVRAILPPSTAADAGFSLEPGGYSIMTILNQRSTLDA